MPAQVPNTFCTIITADYLCYAQTIYESLQSNNSSAHFHVLVVGKLTSADLDKNIVIHKLPELKKQFPADYVSIQKYESDAASNFRWALKPLYLKYLLTNPGYDKAIFIDPDTFFYEDPQFLFDRLDASEVILTPHWRAKNPNQDTANFNLLFTGGLFNAGFFGCNRQAIDILDWWLSVCAYRMEKANGFYVDQAYLNLMPVYFADRVGIVNHKGCNVSNWNRVECKRTLVDGKTLINEAFPIVFIHFTQATINYIVSGEDLLLKPHLESYLNTLSKYKPQTDINTKTAAPTPKNWKSKIKGLIKVGLPFLIHI
jgi:lipopolysaccharide biosynthesis glycosyltransferase